MKKTLYILCIAFLLHSCKKDSSNTVTPDPQPEIKDSVALISMKIESSKNPGKILQDVYAEINGQTVNVTIPTFLNNKKFVVTFRTENASVKVGDTIQESGVTLTDFSKPVDYKLTSGKGTTKTYRIILKNFTKIPVLYLNTSDSITSKDTYVTGTLDINTNQLTEQPKQHIALQAKGRGNSTWNMPKKPYRLKLTEKAEILGMPAAKNWVLLANYSDKTLMRNAVALDLGRKLNASFTPRGLFVELVMNGHYQGNYYLTSQVEVHENRVNIAELKKSATDITGGYLLEQDMRLDEKVWFYTKGGLPITVKSPEDITDAQLAYIKDYLQQTEDAITSEQFTNPEKSYEHFINTASFIDWFIVQEIMKNEDAKEKTSIFYYKDRNGKLGLGPLWDFDIGAGNIDYSDSKFSTGWWIKDGPLFKHLFNDPEFRKKVKQRWNEVKTTHIDGTFTVIDQTASYLSLSQQENFKRWPILNTYVWPNQYVLGSYTSEVAQLKKWLSARVSWLNTEIGKF